MASARIFLRFIQSKLENLKRLRLALLVRAWPSVRMASFRVAPSSFNECTVDVWSIRGLLRVTDI